jgi:hypothetical protein
MPSAKESVASCGRNALHRLPSGIAKHSRKIRRILAPAGFEPLLGGSGQSRPLPIRIVCKAFSPLGSRMIPSISDLSRPSLENRAQAEPYRCDSPRSRVRRSYGASVVKIPRMLAPRTPAVPEVLRSRSCMSRIRLAPSARASDAHRARLSLAACSRIRAGPKVPHLRHWQALMRTLGGGNAASTRRGIATGPRCRMA